MTDIAPLSIRGVELWRDGARLLGPLDLSVETPGVTVLLGANGAGKSLLLRLLHGLTAPATGDVRWGGRGVDAARSEQSFVFQNPPLMRRSVAANIEFPLSASRTPPSDRRRLVAAALDRARLTDKADLPAASLSGGERQRMALARACVTGPSVLLLDEPTASLDPASITEIEATLQKLSREGVKLFLATHDLAQARRLAGDVVFLEAGRIVEQASAEAFFGAPQSDAAARYLAGRL